MSSNEPPRGYSAKIRLELRIAGRTLKLAQIAPDFVILAQPAELPACEAEVVMHVDGKQRRWPVNLPDGIASHSRIVRTVDITLPDQASIV